MLWEQERKSLMWGELRHAVKGKYFNLFSSFMVCSNNKAKEDCKIGFYDRLKETKHGCLKYDVILIVRDLNANIGTILMINTPKSSLLLMD